MRKRYGLLIQFLSLNFLLGLTACGSEMKLKDPYPCTVVRTLTKDDSRPDVLLMGDSISIGYWSRLSEGLPGFDVSHNRCNGRFVSFALKNADEWLDQRPSWDLIVFNHGLHDVTRKRRTSDEDYERDLRALTVKLKQHAPRVIFALTTRVPVGNKNRSNDRVISLNAIAERVMSEEGIEVVDLYSLSLTLDPVAPGDVHYSEENYEILGDAILDVILNPGGSI